MAVGPTPLLGRPTVYTTEFAETICKRVSNGETLRAVCRDLEMSESTVRNWVLDNVNGFAAQYARARELQIEAWGDELREVADDGSNDWMTIQRGGESVEVENREVVNRSRLRVDTLKWLMSKIAHKKYGDKVQQEITGADGGPLVIRWQDQKPGQP